VSDRKDEGGQAAVELALVLPLIALLVLAIVQVGLVVRDQVLVVHAAREAARAAAVDPRPAVARAAALRASDLAQTRTQVDVEDRRDLVIASVSYKSVTDVPLVGPLVPDLMLHARLAMRKEG
jgi:Flp pilus assembly pilin Flp